MRTRFLLASVLAALGSACVTGNLETRDELEKPEGFDALAPGDGLGECLDVLGAPLIVWEQGDGMVLAWAWREERGWGLSASVPVNDRSASFAYRRALEGRDALMLFFDAGWTLVEVKEGALREVLPSPQERAQLVE